MFSGEKPPTNTMQLTKRQRQWLWFIGLFFSGMAAMLVLSGLVRLILKLAKEWG